MRLAETGYTKEDIKGLVAKYMIDTYERFPMIAEHAEDMYIYDENGEAYLDFYAGIAVNSAGRPQQKGRSCREGPGGRHHAHLQLSLHHPAGAPGGEGLYDDRHGQDLLPEFGDRGQ